MKIEDIVIGQEYRIVRKGLVNTGRIGRAVGKNGFKVKLLMHHNNTEPTLNAMSVEPVEKGVKAKKQIDVNENRKPVDNELVKPKKKPAKKFVERDVLIEPAEDAVVLIEKNGVVSSVSRRILAFFDDRLEVNGQDYTKEYLGFIPRGAKFKVNKPDNIMEYPFWNDDDMQDGMELTFKTWRNGFGSTILTTEENFDILAKWIDRATLHKMGKAKVEVDDNGNEVIPPLEEQALKRMEKDAKEAGGLAFALYWDYRGKLESGTRNHAACHYHMRCFVDGDKRKDAKALFAAQFITDHRYYNLKKELVDRYLTWVMNDSPWSDYIVTKDLAEGKEKGIRVRTDIPANAMMCTFYALRYPTEYRDVITLWGRYTDEGLDPTIAFYKAETRGYDRDTASHHGLLDTFSMTLQDVIDFANKKRGKIVDEIYGVKYFNYKNVSVHHGSSKHRLDKTGLDELKDKFKPKKVKEKHPVLGEIEKEIAATEQIDQFLTSKLEK